MYIYFDSNGTLKEIITERPFRVGDVKRNKIYVYWDGEHAPASGWVKYRKPDGTDTTETSFFTYGQNLVEKELPQTPVRNLKYFSYEHTYVKNGVTKVGYQFYEITVPNEVLNSSSDNTDLIPTENNMVVARIRFVMVDNGTIGEIDDSDTIETLGAIVFSVETNMGIITDTSIDETQYNYLLWAIGNKVDTSALITALSSKADRENTEQVIVAGKIVTDCITDKRLGVGLNIIETTTSGSEKIKLEYKDELTQEFDAGNQKIVFNNGYTNTSIEIADGFNIIGDTNITGNVDFTETLTGPQADIDDLGVEILYPKSGSSKIDVIGNIDFNYQTGSLVEPYKYALKIVNNNNDKTTKISCGTFDTVFDRENNTVKFGNACEINQTKFEFNVDASTLLVDANQFIVSNNAMEINPVEIFFKGQTGKIGFSTTYITFTSGSVKLPDNTYIGGVNDNSYKVVNKGYVDTNKIDYSDIINNLTNTSTNKPLSANQGKELKGMIDAINTLLTSDNVNLDTLQEVVDYIENNRTLIEGITTNKISYSDIVDNLTSALANKPLSANMGYTLKGLIDNIVNGTTTVTNATNALKATQDAQGNNIVDTYMKRTDAFSVAMVEVSDYDDATGIVTLTYNSNGVSNIVYDDATGVITFTY